MQIYWLNDHFTTEQDQNKKGGRKGDVIQPKLFSLAIENILKNLP